MKVQIDKKEFMKLLLENKATVIFNKNETVPTGIEFLELLSLNYHGEITIKGDFNRLTESFFDKIKDNEIQLEFKPCM
jgi:hypothetical protein